MRKTLLLLFALCSMAIVAHAQNDPAEPPEPPILFSIGFDAGVALSPTNSTYSSVTGVSGKLEFPFQNQRSFLTVTLGISDYSLKNTATNNADSLANGHFVPLLIGFKFFVVKNIYLEGDVGNSFNINSNYMGYQNAFTYSPAVGISIPLNKPSTAIDIGLRYESRISGDGDINQAAIRVAYTFGL